MRRIASLLALALTLAAPGAFAQTRAFVFGTDYVTGSLSAANLGPRTFACDVASPHSDASLRFYGGQLYVVNRFGGDNVQVVNPATYATVRQFTVGNGSNPHDIAFASATKAYVSRYQSNDLWIVNPATGAHTGTVSLAAFADGDGFCEMDRLHVVGPLLFVSLERIRTDQGYAPDDSGLVAVVDTRTDAIVDCDPVAPGVQAILLPRTNPFTAFQFDPATSRLLIGCVGAFGAADGGIVRINPATLSADGVAITEAALGGDVNDFAWGSAQKSWAIVATTGGASQVVTFAAATGAKLATLWTLGAYELSDLERVGDEVWVCSNSFVSPRVRVFSATTGAVVGSDMVCALPAVAITFDQPSGQTADAGAGAAVLAFSTAVPSPARHATRFALRLDEAGEAGVVVFDAAGRRVRTLLAGTRAAGAHDVAWDLVDDSGARVAPGVYLVRAQARGLAATRRVIVLP
ncbi:MAG: FlgD immunoglobulin-like domain containing protein [Candidatus Eisenbacteria bacterium]